MLKIALPLVVATVILQVAWAISCDDVKIVDEDYLEKLIKDKYIKDDKVEKSSDKYWGKHSKCGCGCYPWGGCHPSWCGCCRPHCGPCNPFYRPHCGPCNPFRRPLWNPYGRKYPSDKVLISTQDIIAGVVRGILEHIPKKSPSDSPQDKDTTISYTSKYPCYKKKYCSYYPSKAIPSSTEYISKVEPYYC